METIIINDHKELYERLADAELFFYIENDGKTITFESPVNKYYDSLKEHGYVVWNEDDLRWVFMIVKTSFVMNF